MTLRCRALHTKLPLTKTEARKEWSVRLHQLPHLVLQPPSKTVWPRASTETQMQRKPRQKTLGIFAGLDKARPLLPKRDVPIPGIGTGAAPRWVRELEGRRETADFGSSRALGQVSSWHPKPRGGGAPRPPKGSGKDEAQGASALLLGLDPPVGEAIVLWRRRWKAHPRPLSRTFPSSLWLCPKLSTPH